MCAIIALVLGVASAAMSIMFALTLPDPWQLWVAIAFGACAAKLVLPAAFAGMTWRTSAALRLSFAVALIIDFSFTGGFASSTRDKLADGLGEQAKARHTIELKVEALKKALDEIPAGRPAEIVAADLKAARNLTKGCRPGTNEAKDERCLNVAALERDAATIESRVRAQAEYDAAAETLAGIPPVIVYPEAHRIAKSLRAIGAEWATDENVSLILAALLVLFLEVGSISAAKRALLANVPAAAPSGVDYAPKPNARSTPRRATNRGSSGAMDYTPAVLSALSEAAAGKPVAGITRDARGDLQLSQRTVQKTLKIPQRALASALTSLEATGRAQISRGPAGTAVRLQAR